MRISYSQIKATKIGGTGKRIESLIELMQQKAFEFSHRVKTAIVDAYSPLTVCVLNYY